MNIIRIVFGILMVIPLALLADVIIDPEISVEDPFLDWVYSAIGVPIAVINYWAWFQPEMIEFFLFGRKRGHAK